MCMLCVFVYPGALVGVVLGCVWFGLLLGAVLAFFVMLLVMRYLPICLCPRSIKNRKTRKNLNRGQIPDTLWIGLGEAVTHVELITRSFSRIDKFRRSRTIG